MKTADLLAGTNTLWVLVTAALVIFMQAGFAFVEVGLTRMKNAGQVAVKNIVVLAIALIVYWAVAFGLAFGDGSSSIIGTSGFFPSASDMLQIGATPFSFFGIPGGAAFMFEVAFAAVSLAIVWGAMAERVKLSTYFIFGVYFTIVYSITSHRIWDTSGWLFEKGMQDFAGSTVVHYQGALAGLVGAFTFTLSFAGLFVLKHTIGLRVSEEDEASGLDIAEHGMWGYPEMYIPVPGVYGTKPHAAAAHTQTLPAASTRSSTAAIPTGS